MDSPRVLGDLRNGRCQTTLEFETENRETTGVDVVRCLALISISSELKLELGLASR